MFVPDILVHFYRQPVCQSHGPLGGLKLSLKEHNILQCFSQKTRFAFFTMMYSTALCTRQRSYPRWIILTKTKPPTLLRRTDIGNEACDILLSSKKAAEVCQMNEEIAEVVSSFRSNSILQMKLLDAIAKCPAHSNLRLILLENVVIDTISMLLPGATDADARQAICNWHAESGVTETTMNLSFLADIQRCQEVVQHNFMLEHDLM